MASATASPATAEARATGAGAAKGSAGSSCMSASTTLRASPLSRSCPTRKSKAPSPSFKPLSATTRASYEVPLAALLHVDTWRGHREEHLHPEEPREKEPEHHAAFAAGGRDEAERLAEHKHNPSDSINARDVSGPGERAG